MGLKLILLSGLAINFGINYYIYVNSDKGELSFVLPEKESALTVSLTHGRMSDKDARIRCGSQLSAHYPIRFSFGQNFNNPGAVGSSTAAAAAVLYDDVYGRMQKEV